MRDDNTDYDISDTIAQQQVGEQAEGYSTERGR